MKLLSTFFILFSNYLAVHSSGAIRAATTKDSSFKCGSVLCRPVSEVFTKENLPKGFLYLTTMAIGASNISIIQVDKSENFLVLKGADDNFIINGDDEPSTSGTYKYQGNSFDYKRGDDYQTITADGPMTRAIDLMILVNGINPGIKYEYYLPVASAGITDSEEMATQWNELGTPLDYLDEPNQVDDNQQEVNLATRPSTNDKHRRNFMWKLIGFSPCSKSCGSGKQAPIFRCIRDSPTRFYTPRRCMHIEKPVFHDIIYQCNTQACPAYWFSEDWGDCFCQGNKGTHRRIVKCLQEVQGGVAVQVENDQCLEDKPPIKEYCPCPTRQKMPMRTEKARIYEHLRGNVQSVTHYKNTTIFDNKPYQKHQHRQSGFREDKSDKTGVWLHSNWNQHCSTKCGLGVEHRSIFCDRTVPYTDLCDLTNTPDTTRTCKSELNCDKGNWFIGNWTECHGDCFNLYRLRKIICIKENVIVDDEECSKVSKPIGKENCKLDEVDYCKARWHYSEWTECSRPCGGGTQKRFVKCLEIDPVENILRESKHCRYLEREPVYSTCNTDKCPSDKYSADIQSDGAAVGNDIRPNCSDEFKNCHLISNKNRERLCKLNYYQKNCCQSCSGF